MENCEETVIMTRICRMVEHQLHHWNDLWEDSIEVPGRYIYRDRYDKDQGHPPSAAASGDGVVGTVTVADDFAARRGEFERRRTGAARTDGAPSAASALGGFAGLGRGSRGRYLEEAPRRELQLIHLPQ